MMLSSRPLGLAGFLVALAVLAACSGPEPQQAQEPEIATIPEVRSAAQVVLPLDAYQQTAAQQHTVTNAVTILGRQCLRRYGLEWPVEQPLAPEQSDPNARRYPVMDRVKASTDGYHALDVVARQREVDDQKKEAPKPTQDAMNVWAGRGQTSYNGQPVPEGGCAGEALRQLAAGAEPVDIELVQRMALDAHGRMREDSRVIAVFKAWSACMKEQGFDYPDPYVANDDQRWQTETVSATEIATAVADVGCKEKTNLVGTLLAVETAYQRMAVDQHVTQLEAVRSYLERQQADAARVVAGGTA